MYNYKDIFYFLLILKLSNFDVHLNIYHFVFEY